ncbi:MAG: nucleotidyltransferase domain-containing protein [Gemmatimonadota bacterium]|nr:nucleotidyltransferase domain-containing protein [Gemmatimonadota bacterium]
MARATMSLDDLVRQLQQVHGDALRAVVLYGSAASGEQVAGYSDYNVMVIVSSIALAQMRSLAQTMRAWQEAGNPPVLELTEAEWQRSADIFPMEYADILERHRLLHGTLPTANIVVHVHHLRLQTEQEAMGKLLRLRRGVMVAGTDVKRQTELLRSSYSALQVIFRAVLRLHNVRPARDANAVIAATAARCGFDPAPFTRVSALVHGTAIPNADVESVLAGYVNGLNQLVEYLDRFAPPEAASDVIHPVSS